MQNVSITRSMEINWKNARKHNFKRLLIHHWTEGERRGRERWSLRHGRKKEFTGGEADKHRVGNSEVSEPGGETVNSTGATGANDATGIARPAKLVTCLLVWSLLWRVKRYADITCKFVNVSWYSYTLIIYNLYSHYLPIILSLSINYTLIIYQLYSHCPPIILSLSTSYNLIIHQSYSHYPSIILSLSTNYTLINHQLYSHYPPIILSLSTNYALFIHHIHSH